MQFDRKDLSNDTLLEFYRQLLWPRMIEEKMLNLLRQGKISKWFSGIGQEAIAVGAALAMKKEEWILPLHRNLGVFTSRKMPLHKLIRQWQGDHDGYSKGRERSFHFGSREHHICGMISHLGPQLAIADGVALAYKLKKEKKVSLAFTGDGGTSEGDFHEALNTAAVWDLPVIFLIENNGYGLSTPVSDQYRCEHLVDRARGYGMEGTQIDGNNLLTVYDTIKGVREYCIAQQKPYLIECLTFRMRGHEEASGTKYVPRHLLELWEKKDPLQNFENYLTTLGVLNHARKESIRQEFQQEIERELEKGFQVTDYTSTPEEELQDVYAPASAALSAFSPSQEKEYTMQAAATVPQPSAEIRMVDAIHDGLKQSMEKHPNLIIMGQDVAEYGGVFKVTEGFADQFGKARVRNTPLCESAILGAALGLALEGYPSVVEMQFADFVSVGFNQIVNNLAKIHYRWGQPAPVVIRMPTGAGVGAGPFHSQSNEAWFTHVPGLKVVYPSTPQDAKGLLIAAINDPNPVLFFEHKALYRSISGPVPTDYYQVEIGQALRVQQGEDLSIITYGAGVHWALDYMRTHPEVSIDLIDLRSLCPLDFSAIRETVSRTGKVVLLHEDTLTGGIGGEIAAWITEHCFELLDAPILRCASLDTPVPFSLSLEKQFLAQSRLASTIERLLAY
ncbi:MAG: thiamine pyrophosphate-dependent enzyme [Chitinophagaceae bacterium]